MRFIIFLAVFFSIYGSFHLYAFLKIRRALALGLGASAVIAVFMTVMVVVPVLIRLSERHGLELFARFLAHLGYTWMGLIFFFVSAAAVLDIYRLLIRAGSKILPLDLSAITLSQPYSFYIAFLIAVIISAYGAFEAFGIRTEHITIPSHKIPQNVGPVRIVQISDVHLGLIVREKRLARILKQVKAANPDILVSTGDLVDGQMDKLTGLVTMLRQVSTKYGKFAVTGNHEFYAGLARSLDFNEKAGFTTLGGNGVTISDWLAIAGVDDAVGKRYGSGNQISENELLSRFSREQFTLFLKHRPVVDENTLGLFDLQLSGHTHKGQIFPFNFVTMLYYPNHAGLLKLEKNSRLYVSRGSGTWGPPIRFLSAPEVTLIELVYEDKNK